MRGRKGIVLGISIALALLLGLLRARAEEPASESADETEIEYNSATDSDYYEDVEPGLTMADKNRGGSNVLTQAMQDGVSLTIGEMEAPQAADAMVQPGVEIYTVQVGDTLWDICKKQFDDPYVWPRIWSYNPEITNPNWIYPGDLIALAPPQAALPEMAAAPGVPGVPGEPGAELGLGAPGAPGAPAGSGGGISKTQKISRLPSAFLIRNQAFIDKKGLDRAGEIVGAHRLHRFLSQYDEAYVEFKKDQEINAGDEFSAFRIVRPVKTVERPRKEIGKLVEILGEVRVTQYDPKSRIARVVIDEVTKEIPRGTMVGLVKKRFALVPPVTNDRDIKGNLIALLDEGVMAATDEIVFVDRGTEDGVREGNRFFAVETRDTYQASIGKRDARKGFPQEVLAEMRVIEARSKTSTCIITSAIAEIEVGQKVEMRKGY